MPQAVRVVPYDPTWPQRFAEERDRLAALLGDTCIAIHHIGSTAIPGASNAFGSLAIPSTINSHRVTTIEVGAFADCTSLTSVTIPDSVTTIEDGAFADCTSLTSVTIPESVTEIESYTFSDCTRLTSVTIPNGVTVIGWGAFEGCTSLTSVTIPDSVTTIRDSAFLGCTSLTSVTIPDSVTTIGYDAFKGCTNLRHAYIIFNKARDIAPTAFEDSTTKIVLWPLAEILSWVYVGAGILLVGSVILWIWWRKRKVRARQ